MLTPITSPPLAIRPGAAIPARAPATAPNPPVKKFSVPPADPQESNPKYGGNSYGEDAKPVSFGGLLHRAIGLNEEPVPAPVARLIKSTAPEPKPLPKARAVGNILPIAVPQESTDPLPLVTLVSSPVANPSSLLSSRPKAIDPGYTQQGCQAATPEPNAEPSDVPPPVHAAPEAFSVRLDSGPSAAQTAPEISKRPILVTEPLRTLTPVAAPVSTATETSAATPISAPAPAIDLKPIVTNARPSVISVESIESPAPVNIPSTPVRDLALRLPGNTGVEVRMSEKSGEVRVEVRTGDQAFTQDLRDNLHELVSGLERKGFSAEVSHPAEHLFARAGETSSSNDSATDHRGGSSAQEEAREQEQNQRRQTGQKFDARSPKARAAGWSQTFDFSLETRNQ